MGIHIEEADAKDVSFQIMKAGDVHSYQGDLPAEEALVLDYGDSHGVLLIYGTPEERQELLERMRQTIMWADAPGDDRVPDQA